MAEDFLLAERLFQGLLNHFWQMRKEDVPKLPAQYPKGYCISYAKIISASGVPLDPRHSGGPLFDVARYCVAAKWEPIHSLVVRAKEGYPGSGFFKAPGTTSSDLASEVEEQIQWSKDVVRCADFDQYPRVAPKIG